MKVLIHLADYGDWDYTFRIRENVRHEDALRLKRELAASGRKVPVYVSFPTLPEWQERGACDLTERGELLELHVTDSCLMATIELDEAIFCDYGYCMANWMVDLKDIVPGRLDGFPVKFSTLGLTNDPLHPVRRMERL